MQLVFDASTQTFDAWWQAVFPATALLFTVIAFARGARWLWKGAGVALTLFLLFAAIIGPILDLHHVQSVMREGRTKTVEGPISMHKRETTKRWTGDSKGVGITSTRRYTSTTSEQFFVGNQWFWLRVDGYGSNASFTNGGNSPLPLHDGTLARVTWFEDPWYDNETRIVKLELGPGPGSLSGAAKAGKIVRVPLGAGSGDDGPVDFRPFWEKFSKAAAGGDRDSVAALTRFPFLFAGTPLDRDRFDSIWIGIFPEPLRPCFGSTTPVKDGTSMSVSCGAYVYVFEKDASGWRLASFTADPEAM
ncbi:MAG: hypothetical protein AB7U35_03725 [Sphingobium sp.]